MPKLVSLNVGLPKDVPWSGETVRTGIFKSPVSGPRTVRRLNIDGDGQGDLGGHGGERRAVLVYQVDSIEHWRRELGRNIEYGSFGENFTVDGLADAEVCIGDRYRIGGAEFEVTQPRVTCYRLGLRLGVPELPALLVEHRRPGFYLRVVTEGPVRAGDDIVRTRRSEPALSVAEIDALLYLPGRDAGRLRLAAGLPALSPGWQQSFHELVAAPAAGAGPAWPGFRSLRVARIVPESSTISSVYLATPDGRPVPPGPAGTYLTVRVGGAIRSYSLSSAPGETQYRISVKREGAVSAYLTSRLRVGDTLDVASPRGDFIIRDGEEPVVLISAGVGVTPVLSMLRRLAAEHSDREVWWVHTAHDERQLAFADEAHRLLAALPRAHEHVFLTASGNGRLSASTLSGLGLPEAASAYVCGPPAFMGDMRAAPGALGLSPDRVFTELFGGRSAVTPGLVDREHPPPHPPPGPPGTGPAVTFARSGLTVHWPGNGPTLLALAESCDVPTRWACRTGVCHTCATGLLSGGVSYDPQPLEPPAPGLALLCCARPEADVVLDL